jgi:hypothetical protein
VVQYDGHLSYVPGYSEALKLGAVTPDRLADSAPGPVA